MGVDWASCDVCGESYPDCGDYDYCTAGHHMCGNCMPIRDREWPADGRYDVDGGLLEKHCPVCKQGGTELQRLRASHAELLAACECFVRDYPPYNKMSGHAFNLAKSAIDNAKKITKATP